MKKKVIVGMSGGIDSSVAALILKNEGYDVVGVSIKHLSDEVSNARNKTCCSLDDINDARIVCYSLGIPHYVVNTEKEFTRDVIREFIEEYKKGMTPNPCVICNERVKIKSLIDMAKNLGFDYVATGHYAVKDEKGYMVYTNSVKDQTYMLYRINKKDLDMMLFPLADMPKSKVREIARENNIVLHDKPDSQGICFAPNGYEEYLKRELKLEKGNFVDESGNILGEHKGYALYTLGQRRGLGLKLPYPVFIIKIDAQKNEIVVGDFSRLMKDTVELVDYVFHMELDDVLDKELMARARFSSKGKMGKLYRENDRIFFKYNEENAENASGQHLVMYFNGRLIGGAKIL